MFARKSTAIRAKRSTRALCTPSMKCLRCERPDASCTKELGFHAVIPTSQDSTHPPGSSEAWYAWNEQAVKAKEYAWYSQVGAGRLYRLHRISQAKCRGQQGGPESSQCRSIHEPKVSTFQWPPGWPGPVMQLLRVPVAQAYHGPPCQEERDDKLVQLHGRVGVDILLPGRSPRYGQRAPMVNVGCLPSYLLVRPR